MNTSCEYDVIFAQRGKDYDEAMQRYPAARDNEFLRLFDHVDLQTFHRLADIPSGGGYLDKFLPADCQIDAFETCDEFNANTSHATEVGLDFVKPEQGRYDAVVCLAAIHHVKDKTLFLTNLYQSLKSGGYLLLGDVFVDNAITRFLDDFAGSHNGTGHSGMYLGIDTAQKVLAPLGAEFVDSGEKDCPWVFDSQQDMLGFCRLLFGFRDVTDDVLLEALQRYVGVSERDGCVELEWQLLYHTVRKVG